MAKRFSNKVAFVTGGARGIGAATVTRLALEGAKVVIADVLDAEGRALAHELRGREAHVGFVRLDVGDEQQWAEALDGTVKTFGALHILVNNAGIARIEDVETETPEGWRRVIEVNQTGAWLGMRAAVPLLRKSGGGSIVNVSSIYGKLGGDGGSIAYHASKGALRTMTKSAAIRYAKEGIRVNSVHPGFIETPMVAPFLHAPEEASRAMLARIQQRTPMGRLGTSEEVAAAIAFLAGDDASYVTGAEIYVDGGWTAA